MGILFSVCKRRPNPLTDVEGKAIMVEDEFDKMNLNNDAFILESDDPDEDSTETSPFINQPTPRPNLVKKKNKSQKL